MQNPYQPNSISPEPSVPPVQSQIRPPVCFWFTVYSVFMLVVYLVLTAVGVLLVVYANELVDSSSPQGAAVDRMGNVMSGYFLSILSAGMSIIFVIGLFIPRRKWGWVYGFIPIAIGLTSPCCIPASLPLLWFWLKPESKQWFNA